MCVNDDWNISVCVSCPTKQRVTVLTHTSYSCYTDRVWKRKYRYIQTVSISSCLYYSNNGYIAIYAHIDISKQWILRNIWLYRYIQNISLYRFRMTYRCIQYISTMYHIMNYVYVYEFCICITYMFTQYWLFGARASPVLHDPICHQLTFQR